MAGAGAAVCLIGSLAACSDPEAEWGAEADQYFADIHASWNSGFANLGTFFAPDATIDMHPLTCRPLAAGRAQGVADLREYFARDDLGTVADEARVGRPGSRTGRRDHRLGSTCALG